MLLPCATAAPTVDAGVDQHDGWIVPAPNASGLASAASVIVAEVRRSIRDRQGGAPMLVALDGGSGSGKSSLAVLVAADLDAAIVESDDFFAAEITDAEWDAMGPKERAAAAIDWRRLRREAIEPLLAGKSASWHPFDFAAGTRPDGTYRMAAEAVTRGPASVIVLDPPCRLARSLGRGRGLLLHPRPAGVLVRSRRRDIDLNITERDHWWAAAAERSL